MNHVNINENIIEMNNVNENTIEVNNVNENIIEVNNVSMMFNLSSEKIDSLKEYVLKLIKGKLLFQKFLALQEVSFTIKRGEVFGLVGLNGAGKSTLLKIIAGVMKPTIGNVKVYGSMAPLIELGAGFNMNLTARENIFLNGAILGHSNMFMKDRYDYIVDFSELKGFIDVPIKNYSSGMVARLAFSIATIIDPDILIVDEILSVGDYKFRSKCDKRIQDLLNKGTTVLFVSHDVGEVKKLCKRALWLENGRMKMIGEVNEVIGKYVN
jgi:ABC-2 type transport system ATP-binding protein